MWKSYASARMAGLWNAPKGGYFPRGPSPGDQFYLVYDHCSWGIILFVSRWESLSRWVLNEYRPCCSYVAPSLLWTHCEIWGRNLCCDLCAQMRLRNWLLLICWIGWLILLVQIKSNRLSSFNNSHTGCNTNVVAYGIWIHNITGQNCTTCLELRIL